VSQVTRVARFFNLVPLPLLFGCWVLTNSFLLFHLTLSIAYHTMSDVNCVLLSSYFVVAKKHTHAQACICTLLDLFSVILSAYMQNRGGQSGIVL
jgi:hypothetical protein